MAIEEKYDLVVVGCGPAGASAALAGAKGGLSVLILDRKRSVGVPGRSGGYVPLRLRRRVWFDDECILQEVAGFRLFLPEGRDSSIKAPGYILDRTRFDKTLAIYALEFGADLANGTVTELAGQRLRFRRGGQEAEVEGRVVIGADGPHSIVGRSIGAVNTEFLVAAQAEVGLKVPFNRAEIWFDKRCVGGYKWFFPTGRTARVGVGMAARYAPLLKGLLGDFLNHLSDQGRIYRESVLSYSGGSVPVGRLLSSPACSFALLAGDAAGCADMVTWAGIGAAVLSGTLAGEIAAKAIRSSDLSYLTQYPSKLAQVMALDRMIERKYIAERFQASGDFLGLVENAWAVANAGAEPHPSAGRTEPEDT